MIFKFKSGLIISVLSGQIHTWRVSYEVVQHNLGEEISKDRRMDEFSHRDMQFSMVVRFLFETVSLEASAY